MSHKLVVTAFAPADYVNALKAADVSDPQLGNPLEHGRAYATYGPSFTGWIDDQIAVCSGIMIPWPGRGECWAVWTPTGYEHPGLIHRAIIRFLRRLIRDYQLVRLQADVIADFIPGCNWVRHLGFHLEGLMPLYGPHGETFARYAWLHPNAAISQPAIVEPDASAIVRTADGRMIGMSMDDGRFIPAISGGYDGGASLYIMIALTVAAAAASAYATYSSGQAQKAAYKYNAAEAETQAQIAKQQAEFQAQQQAERDRRTRAAARAIQSTTGVEVGVGSSLLVDVDNARQAELNYQAVKFQSEATQRAYRSQSTLSTFQGGQAERQANIGAGVSLLSGASSGYSQYQRGTIRVPEAQA